MWWLGVSVCIESTYVYVRTDGCAYVGVYGMQLWCV